MSQKSTDYPIFNSILITNNRMQIMTVLMVKKSVDIDLLSEILEINKDDISKQMGEFKKCNYVHSIIARSKNRETINWSITETGRKIFEQYVNALKSIVLYSDEIK